MGDRQEWLGQLARAPSKRLVALWAEAGFAPEHETLRAPETGTVMVTGRMGGTGAPFNLGEMTVTRCSLALQDGAVGHGYVQGRSHAAARCAALADALLQTDQADAVRRKILTPLAADAAQEDTTRAARAAATKVEFFTLARGEDP